MTDTYNPSDYTVDQVNDFLDDHPDLTGDVLAAEAEGQGRVGILQGRHATPQDDASAPVDLNAAAYAQGFHGAIPSQADDVDDVLKAKPVEEAAADQNVVAPEDSYFGTLPEPDDATKPVPMADQVPPPEHLAQTEASQKGYFGELPNEDDRPDLTFAAAAKAAQEQYGDGKPQ